MIKRKNEFEKIVKEEMRGGEGEVLIEKLWEPETEMKANNRLFAKLTLAGTGQHKQRMITT